MNLHGRYPPFNFTSGFHVRGVSSSGSPPKYTQYIKLLIRDQDIAVYGNKGPKENPHPELNTAIEGVLHGHAVPRALLNTSVAKLYALYAEKPNFRLRYDSILAELERLETTLHDPLPEGDIRRDSGNQLRMQFEDEIVPAFMSIESEWQQGGVMGAGGRALKQLEQQYRNTIADGLGRTASDPEVEVTVASHMAPMKKRMMAMHRHEEKVQHNRDQMATVLVEGTVDDVPLSRQMSGVGASSKPGAIMQRRFAIEQRFTRQLELVCERIQLAIDAAHSLPKGHGKRGPLLVLRRHELMAVQQMLSILKSDTENPQARQTILMNLEQEPDLFRQWLGTENGQNDWTKY